MGPISESERATLSVIHEGLVIERPQLKDLVLATTDAGTCLFLGPTGCALHSQLGPEAKPRTCNRFPFGLTATPTGGRVVTSHRCPCRSFGKRPEVEVEEAREALLEENGRLRADRRIEATIHMTADEEISFEQYEEQEKVLIDQLLSGADPRKTLGYEPYPALSGVKWRDVGKQLAETAIENRYSVALLWMGHALLAAHGGRRGPWPPRPWMHSFDHVEQRSDGQSAHTILGDWAADEVWSLEWTRRMPFDERLAELASLLDVGYRIVGALKRQGAAEDRAAAEAVTILDLANDCDEWLAAWR